MTGAKSDLESTADQGALLTDFARALGLKGAPDAAQSAYLAQIAADLAAEELPPVTPEDMAARQLLPLLRISARRRRRRAPHLPRS